MSNLSLIVELNQRVTKKGYDPETFFWKFCQKSGTFLGKWEMSHVEDLIHMFDFDRTITLIEERRNSYLSDFWVLSDGYALNKLEQMRPKEYYTFVVGQLWKLDAAQRNKVLNSADTIPDEKMTILNAKLRILGGLKKHVRANGQAPQIPNPEHVEHTIEKEFAQLRPYLSGVTTSEIGNAAIAHTMENGGISALRHQWQVRSRIHSNLGEEWINLEIGEFLADMDEIKNRQAAQRAENFLARAKRKKEEARKNPFHKGTESFWENLE